MRKAQNLHRPLGAGRDQHCQLPSVYPEDHRGLCRHQEAGMSACVRRVLLFHPLRFRYSLSRHPSRSECPPSAYCEQVGRANGSDAGSQIADSVCCCCLRVPQPNLLTLSHSPPTSTLVLHNCHMTHVCISLSLLPCTPSTDIACILRPSQRAATPATVSARALPTHVCP